MVSVNTSSSPSTAASSLSPLEYRLQPDDQLCFIHIMKTAGSTFTSLIDARFHVSEICPHPLYLEEVCPEARHCQTVEEKAELLTRYRLIRGHFTYAEIAPLLKQPRYLTILRDPIERAISFYEFMRRSSAQPKRGDAHTREMLKAATSGSLLEFVSHPDPGVRRSVTNHQTWQLATASSPVEPLTEENVLAIAKQNLKDCVFFGLTERFQDSMFLLSYIFGWYPIVDFQSLRVATDKPSRDTLDDATVEAILRVNDLDIALYQYAEELLEERFNFMVKDLEARYAQPEDGAVDLTQQAELVKFLERHYTQRQRQEAITPAKFIDFEFQQPISGEGWHRRNGEQNGLVTDAVVFRWTGPGTTAILDFPLADDEDLRVKVYISNAANLEILNSLQLLINDRPLNMETLYRDRRQAVVQAAIPKAALQSDRPFARLALQVSHTQVLRSPEESKVVPRPVGVAVNRIQIFRDCLQPGDADYPYVLFPNRDHHWTEVADFLQGYVQTEMAIAAPDAFIERFPHQAQ
jgi:hypothetical protein